MRCEHQRRNSIVDMDIFDMCQNIRKAWIHLRTLAMSKAGIE